MASSGKSAQGGGPLAGGRPGGRTWQPYTPSERAPVAQLDRAPASGAGSGGSSPSGRTNRPSVRTLGSPSKFRGLGAETTQTSSFELPLVESSRGWLRQVTKWTADLLLSRFFAVRQSICRNLCIVSREFFDCEGTSVPK